MTARTWLLAGVALLVGGGATFASTLALVPRPVAEAPVPPADDPACLETLDTQRAKLDNLEQRATEMDALLERMQDRN